jgi:hypothetical protein
MFICKTIARAGAQNISERIGSALGAGLVGSSLSIR